MFTTTSCEFSALYCDAKRVYRDAVSKYNKLIELGNLKEYDRIEELALYLDVLGSWEQEKFTYLSYVNTMNDYDVRAIFTRVKQLIHEL